MWQVVATGGPTWKKDSLMRTAVPCWDNILGDCFLFVCFLCQSVIWSVSSNSAAIFLQSKLNVIVKKLLHTNRCQETVTVFTLHFQYLSSKYLLQVLCVCVYIQSYWWIWCNTFDYVRPWRSVRTSVYKISSTTLSPMVLWCFTVLWYCIITQ